MSYPNLHLLLQAANRRELFLGLVRVSALGLAVLLVSLAGALTMDAIVALPVWLRLGLDAALVAVLLFSLWRLLRVLLHGRFAARRVARMIEQRLGMTSSALINAVDLRDQPRGSVSRRLTEESVELGEQAARRVDLNQALQGRPARRAALSACAVFAGTLLAYMIMPGVFARGLPRLLDPAGNHPPFTLVHFDVQVQPNPLYFGSPATVSARLSGPLAVDRADCVFVVDGRDERLPMIEDDEGYRLELAEADQPRAFYIDTPKGRSDWYLLDVQQVPRFEDVWVTYTYPPYTDWASRRHRLGERDIEAMTGTGITLEAYSRFPLAEGNVEIFADPQSSSPSEQLRMLPDRLDPLHVRGEFRLTHSGRLTMRLVGHNQQPGPEVRESRLIARDDRPPQVSIEDPEPIALAVENWTVPLSIEAVDDVQVTDLQAHYQLRQNGQLQPPGPQTGSQAVSLQTVTTRRQHAIGKGELDLAKLAARAGDEIRCFATAADNNPNGRQNADSPTHVIQVISHEQYLDYLRMAYQMEQLSAEIEQLNERLTQLAQHRDQALELAEQFHAQLAAGQSLDEPQRKQLDELMKSVERFAQQSGDLSQQMSQRLAAPQLYDAERAYRDQLEQMAQQLRSQQDHAAQLQQALEAIAQGAAPQPEDQRRLQESWRQFQQSAAPFDPPSRNSLTQQQRQSQQLLKAARMLDDVARIEQVVRQQRQLADRLQPLSDGAVVESEQRRADRLAGEQERLDQELQEAEQGLREAAEQAAQDLPRTVGDVCRLCDAIQQLGIGADQRRAARAARQGAAQQAAQAADQAADKLESLADRYPSTQQVGEELNEPDADRGLRLSTQEVQRTLQQLGQAQSLPRLGSGGAQPGPSAAMSAMGLHGPQPPQEAFSNSQRVGRGSEQHQGRHDGSSPDEPSAGAELIDAMSRSTEIGGAGNLRGVPVGYRDQAEAYFRRLAEESTRDHRSP